MTDDGMSGRFPDEWFHCHFASQQMARMNIPMQLAVISNDGCTLHSCVRRQTDDRRRLRNSAKCPINSFYEDSLMPV